MNPQQVKMVPQPERLRTPLYVHQKANIYAMEQMEKNQCVRLNDSDVLEANVGILGDPPGTGKTKTIIGLICRDKMKWTGPLVDRKSQVCSNVDGSIRIVRVDTQPCIQTTLIVTPPSIFGQWESELKESDLSYKMIKERAAMTDVEKYEVVVVTISMFNSLMEKYRELVFKRFVYDEMDSAYIPNMAEVKAGFQWFVSATFSEVIDTIRRSRRIHHMKHLFMNILSFEYSQHRLLETITVRSTERLRNLRPVPMEYESKFYDVNRAPVVNALGEYMDRNLIAMIDAGNIRDAIRHLGGDEESTDIAALLRGRAANELAEAERKVDEYKGRQRDEWVTRLAAARRKMDDIERKIVAIQEDDCSLCAVKMVYPVLVGCCQHLGCAKCMVKWVNQHHSCPFCRHANPHLTHIRGVPQNQDPDSPGEMKIASPHTKFDYLVNIARAGKKVLLFASHDNQFKEISAALQAHGISYGMLTGAVSRREAILTAYTKGDTRVLILNSRLNGAGLNLQVSTDIVMWHSMSAPLTKQLIGRALRYGLDHPIVVHKFYPREEDGIAQEKPARRRRGAAADEEDAGGDDEDVSCH